MQVDPELKRFFQEVRYPAPAVRDKTVQIARRVLEQSKNIQSENFTAIGVSDLQTLFDAYDRLFFGGHMKTWFDNHRRHELTFRLSKRMTRVGGTTACFKKSSPLLRTPSFHYEITISTPLLFQSYRDYHRPILVNGLLCRNRLESLQRVFEHEMVHLIEMIAWGNSSCSAPNFFNLANGIFAHRGVRHDMVTQSERAGKNYNLHPGDRVSFQTSQGMKQGLLNRITRRATVLVENSRGKPYTDGKRYLKFYVPLNRLRKIS